MSRRVPPSLWLPALLGLSFAVAPCPAEAQSSYVNRALMAQLEQRVRDDYAFMRPISGMLREDGEVTIALPVLADRRYVIAGVCDGDCDDVDIVIRNARGEVVASDRASDDAPVVEFVAAESATYSVSVVLASCATSVCEVGANVFVRHRRPTEASRADVDGRLARLATALAERGWRRAANPVIHGLAAEDDTEPGTIVLAEGRSYQVAGVCDEDCDDLDLMVLGPDGESIGMDDATDAIPLVGFTAPASGVFQLGVHMASCETPTCVFAVAVFEQGGAPSASSSASTSTSTTVVTETDRRPECTVAGARESIVVGEVRRGDLATATCRFRNSNAIYYRLQVTAPQRITFDLSGTGMDPYLTLLDGSGTQLASDDDGGGDRAARLSYAFSPGTYYIVARGLATVTSGQYTLSARD